jgi:putative ABC transport system ATP-binding protein
VSGVRRADARPRAGGAPQQRNHIHYQALGTSPTGWHTICTRGDRAPSAIARAIAGDPALILADEPTGNLDSLMARQVMDLLEQINEMGTTIVLVTHDPELARRAQRNIHIVDGLVIDSAPYERRMPAEAAHAGAGGSIA